MSPETKSGVITGAIGTLSAIASGIFLFWLAKPHQDSGKVLYISERHDESDSYAAKPNDTRYIQTVTIYNVSGELNNLDVIIPLNNPVPVDLDASVKPLGAVVKGVTSPESIKTANAFVVNLINLKEYGQVTIRFKTKDSHIIFDDQKVTSSNENVAFFRPDEAWQYID